MRRCALFASFLFATSTALAQAPTITPKGDPSVASDTIYRLAVNPADYPDESVVLLLDDGVVRIEPDGRSTRTYRQVVQVLKDDAIEAEAEHILSYSPGHQRLRINWMRVVKPSGEIVSDKPAHEQESDVPASIGDPVYSDRKVHRVSLSGVAVGTLVDYSYTIEELKPYRAGDFFDSWSVSAGTLVKRSRYLVDVPDGFNPVIRERNLSFARREARGHGRHVYIWATSDVPHVKGEPYAADSNSVMMSVAVSAPTSWNDIAHWYAGLARDRYHTSPTVDRKVRELVAGAKTMDDTLRAVQRWVAQDIRYLSIALGLSGYQPRPPDSVVQTGFGDCKDKATLFVAALKTLGLTAYPVLLSSDGDAVRGMPSISQFDHAIAAVERPGGYLFVDLTSELTPLGSLPYAEQGAFALVVRSDGSGDEVTLPADALDRNRSEAHLVGTLDEDGLFDGRFENVSSGIDQYTLRRAFEEPLDSTKRANLMRSIASRLFPGSAGDSLDAFDGKDLRATPHMSMHIEHGKATSSSGDTEIFAIPFGSMEGLATAADEVEARGTRHFPIDAERVFGASTSVTEMRVTLPPGWKARLPKNVNATSAFGSYSSEYAQDGRELRITRRITGAKGVYPPERVGELVSFFRAVAKDDAKFIVLERPTSP